MPVLLTPVLCLSNYRQHRAFPASSKVDTAQTPCAEGQVLSCLPVVLICEVLGVDKDGEGLWWLTVQSRISCSDVLISPHVACFGAHAGQTDMFLLSSLLGSVRGEGSQRDILLGVWASR